MLSDELPFGAVQIWFNGWLPNPVNTALIALRAPRHP